MQRLFGWPVRAEKLKGFSRFESPIHLELPEYRHACDFIVPYGTEVLAMVDGEVSDVRQHSKKGGNDLVPGMSVLKSRFWDAGNRIEVDHGDGEYSAYEHLAYESARIDVGDEVKKGDVIAVTGMTGLLAHLGGHVHAERFVYDRDCLDGMRTLRILWEDEKVLIDRFLWDYNKWREIGNSRAFIND